MAEQKKGLEEVRDVLKRNKRDLIDRLGAEGVAIGKNDPSDEEYVITVYLATGTDVPDEAQSIEGVPLKFIVSGKFKAQK